MPWKQCSKHYPCPICQHDGWCTYIIGGSGELISRCMRLDVAPPGWRRIKVGEGSDGARYAVFAEGCDGWSDAKALAWLRSRPMPKDPQPEHPRIDPSKVLDVAAEYEGDLQLWANSLDIPRPTLESMGCVAIRGMGMRKLGLSAMDSLLTPMYDKPGSVCGYRVRPVAGKKVSVPGSRNGLFAAGDMDDTGDPAPLHIPEGETDTGVLLHCKYAAIGRPNNSAGAHFIAANVHPEREIIIWADNDAPRIVNGRQLIAGIQGAMSVARHLIDAGYRDVSVAIPHGHKDLREVWQHVARGNMKRMHEAIARYPRQRMTRDVIRRYMDRMGTQILLDE